MTDNFLLKIKSLLKNELENLGYEFWGCLYTSMQGGSVLQIFIEKNGGVTLGDCEIATKHVRALLDVEALIHGAYRLEVSSPGIDRILFELSHFQRYIGKKIKIRLHMPLEGRRNFGGVLLSADEERGIVIADGDQELCVKLAQIDRARLEPEI